MGQNLIYGIGEQKNPTSGFKILLNKGTIMREMIKKFIPQKLLDIRKDYYFNHHYLKSYNCDDIILRSFFAYHHGQKLIKKLFYVDVGSNHPILGSVTYNLYLDGCSGINIDPNPGTKELFNSKRPRDINLELGVSDEEGVLELNLYSVSQSNSFIAGQVEREDVKAVGTCKVRVQRLETILESHLPEGQQIDIMNIDTEGYDYRVLLSNNWSKFRPTYVHIEQATPDIETIMNSDIYIYMLSVDYRLKCVLSGNTIYEDNKAAK